MWDTLYWWLQQSVEVTASYYSDTFMLIFIPTALTEKATLCAQDLPNMQRTCCSFGSIISSEVQPHF